MAEASVKQDLGHVLGQQHVSFPYSERKPFQSQCLGLAILSIIPAAAYFSHNM